MTGQRPDYTLERQCGGLVCGIDEVGRGPLAGPVVAACVILPPHILEKPYLQVVNDSKKLTAKHRESLFAALREDCPHAIGMATPEEIDTLNIHRATLLAMKRAYDSMTGKATFALIDGRFAPDIDCACQTVIKGDSLSLSIAAASVIAKVTRDRIMAELHEDWPHYGWNRNAGYGTAQHLEGLKRHGLTPHHRCSFNPVRQLAAA